MSDNTITFRKREVGVLVQLAKEIRNDRHATDEIREKAERMLELFARYWYVK